MRGRGLREGKGEERDRGERREGHGEGGGREKREGGRGNVGMRGRGGRERVMERRAKEAWRRRENFYLELICSAIYMLSERSGKDIEASSQFSLPPSLSNLYRKSYPA